MLWIRINSEISLEKFIFPISLVTCSFFTLHDTEASCTVFSSSPETTASKTTLLWTNNYLSIGGFSISVSLESRKKKESKYDFMCQFVFIEVRVRERANQH